MQERNPIGPAVGQADESSSWATGINEDGKVVITSVKVVVTPQFTLRFINSSWTWQDGETTKLPDPRSGGCASASGINDPGQIVGTSCGSSSYRDQAMLWIDGEGQLLGTLQGVDDAGNVKGASTGNAINNRGQVVGYSTFSDTSTATHAFLWDRGAMLDLFPGANTIASTAVAINNSTQVVGYFKQTGAPTERAFVWDNGQAYDLNSLINEPDSRILLIRAFAINERGDISGVALDFRSGAMKVAGFLLRPTK
jgi:probable HAF family extracellular repeat protein